MAIRDITYFGWKTVPIPSPVSGQFSSRFAKINDMAFSGSDVYFCGTFVTSSADAPTGANIVGRVFKTDSEFKNLKQLDSLNKTIGASSQTNFNSIVIDGEGAIYVCGQEAASATADRWILRKSHISASTSWETIDHSTGSDASSDSSGQAIAIDSSNGVYVVGTHKNAGAVPAFVVRHSSTGLSGSFSVVLEDVGSAVPQGTTGYDITIDSNDTPIATGRMFHTTGGGYRLVIYSASAAPSTWEQVLNRPASTEGWRICKNSLDEFFVVGDDSNIYGSSNGSSGSWVVRGGSLSAGKVAGLAADSKNNLYVMNVGSNPAQWEVNYYATGSGATLTKQGVDNLTGSLIGKGLGNFDAEANPNENKELSRLRISPDDTIYYFGNINAAQPGIVRYGKRTSNSASIGERMLATSIGYTAVNEVDNGGANLQAFKLMNVSEFPHSSGLFQMRNMILGTIDAGKVGKSEDSIVQVSKIGSVVNLMWPARDNQRNIKGFSDGAQEDNPGILVTNFIPGDFVDVSKDNFDNLSLHCYLLKDVSGTLDNIEVKIERRSLRSLGFTSNQTVNFTASTNTEDRGILRDEIYRREIDYGNLVTKEVGFSIPNISLKNVKDLRISARHVTGQSESNSNFIIWGRFIKSEEET